MLSNVISALATNFQTVWNAYGNPGVVPWFYGPKYITIQTAPPQITAVLYKEKFVGPEQHGIFPFIVPTWLAGYSTKYGYYLQAAGYYFQAISGTAITGSTQPSWPTPLGSTVSDGTVLWQNTGTAAPALQPREINRCWSTVMFACWGSGSTLLAWTPNTLQPQGSFVCPTVNNQNGFYYSATQAFEGFTNVSEPLWPEFVGETVIDGTTTWTNMGIVDNFRIHDWDQVDMMRTCLSTAIHATALGQYKINDGLWYDKTDQLVMDGFTYKMFVDFLVPMPDLAEQTELITSETLTPLLIPNP